MLVVKKKHKIYKKEVTLHIICIHKIDTVSFLTHFTRRNKRLYSYGYVFKTYTKPIVNNCLNFVFYF